MKTLVISKPVYDYIMPLVEFPLDGDKFFINNSINSLSGIGTLVSIIFAKYNIDVKFTGMVGEDYIGNKIKEILSSYKIDTSLIETSYTESTCKSYKIYNSKTNKFTSIEENSLKTNLTKYKYEFIPDVIVMDDKDYGANLAALNNYPNALHIFIGDKFTKESSTYLNKCKYVICDIKFASMATGVGNDLDKPKNIVNLFQKYVDLYKSNLIIRLDNYDILYCIEDEVRIIKNINKNINNKENVYYGVLSFFLSNNIDIENSIKFTNKVMLSSLNELDMIKNIPDVKLVYECLENYKNNQNMNVQNNTNLDNINKENKQNIINNETVVNVETNNSIVNSVENTVNISQNNNSSQVETPILNKENNNGVNDVERL